jgi:hypothetical protein
MDYRIEGLMLARMAKIAYDRRKPNDTAIAILEEMIVDLGIAGVSFQNLEDWPGHPLGDLIAEAFGRGRKFPILAAISPHQPGPRNETQGKANHGDGPPFSEEQENVETQAYYQALDDFRKYFHLL